MTCIYCRAVLAHPIDGRVIECRPERPGGLRGHAIACADVDGCDAREHARAARDAAVMIGLLGFGVAGLLTAFVFAIARAL